ncbi:MAG: type I-C CRISPR-associated protein Cas5c [Syntrophaceticus schinkii]|jgi:CRISPR-associated protein Cas5d|nr:type I-C CRISPR-associated protein Cas5c [Syntrophaceticus schinkii]MDD4261930.1 type I-C CRISPR-associated protein Cas5c [Syntrophaceticus schinkii]
MPSYPPLEVKVWGEFGCFTRPDMKVERVSYPMMTPSAARGVLEAILWKPEFQWQVRQIAVLKPIKHFSILRNEVNSKLSLQSVKRWVKSGGAFYADEDRAQRHTLALRDVAYIIRADILLAPHSDDNIAKYRDMFRRRVCKGQCYHTPYLGCREFSAFFGEPSGDEQPVPIDDDLGLMLFDMDFVPDGLGKAKPIFFHAYLEQGVLNVPQDLYQQRG